MVGGLRQSSKGRIFEESLYVKGPTMGSTRSCGGGGGCGPLFSGFQNEAQPWPIPSPKPCILWSRNPEPETPKHCCRMLSLVRGTFTHAPQSKAKQNRSRPGAKTLNRKKLPRSLRCTSSHALQAHTLYSQALENARLGLEKFSNGDLYGWVYGKLQRCLARYC